MNTDAVYLNSLPMTDGELDNASNALQALFNAADAIMANPIYADAPTPTTQAVLESGECVTTLQIQ